MVEAILNDTGEVLPGSMVLDGEYGLDDVGLGVGELGSDGVEEVVEWELTADERDLLTRPPRSSPRSTTRSRNARLRLILWSGTTCSPSSS